MRKQLFAGIVATSLLVPGALLAATPAAADSGGTGRCGGAEYDLKVDRKGRTMEVEAEIDHARPGSAWRIALSHNGTTFFNQVRTADNEGSIEIERYRTPNAGKNRVVLVVTPAGGKSCSAAFRAPTKGTARGMCRGADIDIEVEPKGRRVEVEAELERAKAGSKWRVVMWQNGKVYYSKVHKAGRTGKIKVERIRSPKAGTNSYQVVFRAKGGKAKPCSAAVVMH